MEESNILPKDIYVEKSMKQDRIIYKHYLYDIFIAKIQVTNITNKRTNWIQTSIVNFSTINFQWNPETVEDQIELDDFIEIQKEYKISKKLLEDKIWYTTISNLWSIVFENAIADIRLAWNKYIKIQIAWTSRWFYQKICERLKEKNLIKQFWLSHKWMLNIELTTR